MGAGSHPLSCPSVPSCSVTALGGWRPLPRLPAVGCHSSLESPHSQQFPPPCLPCLDHQEGWMEAGPPRTGQPWVWLCPSGAVSSKLSVLPSAVSPETPRLPQEAPDSLFPLLHGEASQIRQASPRNEQPGSHQDPVQEIQGASREEKGMEGVSNPLPTMCVCVLGSAQLLSKTRAQALPGEGLAQLSMGQARCSFSPVRPVRLPWLSLSWFPGSVGWRLVGSVRVSNSS